MYKKGNIPLYHGLYIITVLSGYITSTLKNKQKLSIFTLVLYSTLVQTVLVYILRLSIPFFDTNISSNKDQDFSKSNDTFLVYHFD
jgi:hypothetical protein